MVSSLPATIPTTGGLSVEGASAPLLDELLKDLAAELRKQGVPLDGLLRPPAPPQMVRESFAEIGLRAPDEAVTLYGWCDGFRAEGSVLPLPVFEVLPLEGMVGRFRRSRLGLGEWDWNPNWVQVMGSKYGLAICCADEPDKAPLVRSVEDSYRTQDWQTDYQVVSLCTPVVWWIDAIRRGWYRYQTATGTWDRDLDKIPLHIQMYEMS